MKNIIHLLLIGIFLVSLSSASLAQSPRKKIGIALSGGGAKGLAHIGVLKVLEEAGIYPDVIAGTSMGSVVGGLYAIGYSSQELDSLAKSLQWTEYFTDLYDRSYRTIEEKEEMERYIFSFPVKAGVVQLPKGFVDGQKLTILLSNLTQKVHSIKNFDDFKIPFRCVGGDIETGKAVVFDSGFLPDAIRASIGIPSVFEPVEVDGRLVVDGMIVRNLPVQDAFDMGADIVIAVDVGSGLYKREELTSIITVLEQTSSYQIVSSNEQQLKLANLVIRPDISPFSALDFEPVDSLIHAGEVAAKVMLPEIKKLLGADYNKQILRKGIVEDMPTEVKISKVDIIGLVGKDEQTFLKILQIKENKTHEVEDISDQINLVAATGFYNKMSYRLIPEQDGYRLKIRADKTDDVSIKIGANYHNTFNAGLLVNGTIRNTLLQGSKLSIDLRVSENPALRASYLYYTKTRPNIGLRLSGIVNFHPGFIYVNDQLFDEYNFLKTKSRLDIFSGLGKNTSVGIGISTETNRIDKRFFEDENETPATEQFLAHLNFDFDNLNRKYFPTKGTQLKLSGNLVLAGDLINSNSPGTRNSTNNNHYSLFGFRQLFAVSPGFVVEWYNHAGYSAYDDPDYIQLFYLGRALPYQEKYLPFSGFNFMELPADRFAFSGVKLQLEPASSLFLAFSYNYVYFRTPEFTYITDGGSSSYASQKDVASGVGLEVGALSNFGPISLTSEYNFDNKMFNFLFQMGFSF